MRERGSAIPAFLLLLLAIAVFGVLLYINARPAPELVVLIPTQPSPTDEGNAWQELLEQGFGSNSTPLPTIALRMTEYVPPTLESSGVIDTTPVAPLEVTSDVTATEISFIMTPTRPAPTPAPLATDVPVTAQVVTRPPSAWQPPPLIPPISRDPYGRDHYWFIRPVDSDGANYGLSYYPFGSNGTEEFSMRVHHGIDMSNPIGETVRAAGSGTVVWAADGLRTEGSVFENSPSYGNVIVIEHDFGYRGEKLWTIYAHLSAVLVLRDEHVEAGDAIGLVGNSGNVTGPHVHFEVRMRENRYAANYNPVLWMVPYVGHGVIAGRVTDADGNRIDDADVTIRNWATGLVEDTTATYLYQGTAYDVNEDPIWHENFAIGDIPTGRYEVIANINGLRVSRIVDVLEGTTSFVELSPSNPATQQAAAQGS